MQNLPPPSLAPRASRSASKGANPDAFDANVDYPAELGASPVPPDTPTHPALYKGALAYGSPKKSKLPSRVRYIPSPTTTPDDDQDLPNNKKKRRTSEKGPAYFDVCKLTSDDIDDIIEEDRNLHPDERKQQAFAAPPQQDTKKAPNSPPTLTYKSRANTPSIPTAKVTTLTNFAQPAHNPIFQAPGCMNPSGFSTLQKTCKDLHDCLFAHLFNLPFHPSPSKYQPPSTRKQQQCQGESKEPPTLIHPSHPGLESEIATFTHRIASFGYTPTLTEFTGFLQHHEDLEDLVIIAIKMTGDEQLMPILDLLILVRSVIGQRNSHSVPPAHRMVDILAKFERIPTDGSREMTVQNFPSPPRVLVDVDNSAASRTKTMTCHDRSAELGTRNFCAETPDSVQTPFASMPLSPDNRRIHSPCYPETPSPRPNVNDHSADDASTRPFSQPASPTDDSFDIDPFVHFAPRGP
ncbi:hypothetical protein MHU86_16353 [Fragilaria crotonensis]|nr:hypothetical protein MHU86_16353 [Fragilaria crotonensis]